MDSNEQIVVIVLASLAAIALITALVLWYMHRPRAPVPMAPYLPEDQESPVEHDLLATVDLEDHESPMPRWDDSDDGITISY